MPRLIIGKARVGVLLALLAVAVPTWAQRIGPLIDAPWGQGEPFNRHCPLWDGKYSVEVGCVATAMTQIMAYYRYPECTLDTLYGWRTDHIVTDTILPGARIDWDNIRNDYRSSYSEDEAEAVADLALYAALAARMNFGRESSGANTSRYVEELPRVFGYRSCIGCDRAYYTQDAWRQLLINEFEQGRPVLYTAHNMDFAGHAFVLDGYDYATGRFHANWGYNGTFDRWVDIDVMGQFEHPDDPTFWGQREALYCNHYALLVHPTEEIRPAADSIMWHDGDVSVDWMRLVTDGKWSKQDEGDRQTAYTGGYEMIDIQFTNHRADTVAYTFEVLSNAPADSSLFAQADYVALGCAVLQPGESKVFRTSARFSATGERVLRLSNDDQSLMCPTDVTVEKGHMLKIGFDEPRLLKLTSDEAQIAIDINVERGNSGTLITYCLFPDDSEEDWRHWQLLPTGTSGCLTDTVTFRQLEPDTKYTFKLRWPWDVRSELTFTTMPDNPTNAVQSTGGKADERFYDLSGRRLPKRPAKGVYISNKSLGL